METTVKGIPISVNLGEILKKKGITPRAMALDLGIDPGSIYDLKNKLVIVPNLRKLLIICNYLNIQISDMIKIKYEDE